MVDTFLEASKYLVSKTLVPYIFATPSENQIQYIEALTCLMHELLSKEKDKHL